ncbi:unnamed protein product [Meloidogyne enterolobii]|uniref:Uncharacterized protein n=1 Tax=Meloidogyne enterolobii TaxID=390850 RepID=A0ACB1APZ9_MELEN
MYINLFLLFMKKIFLKEAPLSLCTANFPPPPPSPTNFPLNFLPFFAFPSFFSYLHAFPV